ncbi:acyltransferase [Rhodoblastus acidophilus]|uniref:Acyltransferase n=1 Tax=Candidatus Rhodoblastus alkanivorans TaxID=2954117 RepID=A0ABS9Z415_9HYPH|nr:acyltransferase [Candidatus Rhodoblastus alkanivorans]MCI4677558.1 acyltransferase [Candidatus Rhodoblastus alkanivorans]MCI4681917.1 acyltransferase [Candidatus Rhodoblastus alkanivorans]MDI4642967.1 acyltransferase [Rhodoblastus acidophilus]
MPLPVLGVCAGAVAAFGVAMATGHVLANAGFPLPSREKRIGQIDGLRGFLALSVMVHHFAVWLQMTRITGTWAQLKINFFEQLGSTGVALFFMTTGLLFYPRILAGFRANSWPALYITRVFRLVPMSIAAFVLVTLVVMLRTGHGLDADFPGAALRWIFAAGMPPLLGYEDSGRVNAYVLWSLTYEWLFYLAVLPVCAIAMDLSRGKLPSWALPFAVILVGVVFRHVLHDFGFSKFLPLFGTGMLAFEAQSRPALAARLRAPAMTLPALAALLASMILFKTPLDLAWPLLALFFFAVASGNDMGGLLATKAALVLGECSYGIYLTHGIVLFALFTFGGALTGLFPTPFLPVLLPLVALVVVLLTATTYLLVERPGMKAGRLLANRWRALAARRISFAPD